MTKIKTLFASAIAVALTVSLGASASVAADGASPLSGLPGGAGKQELQLFTILHSHQKLVQLDQHVFLI
jgi:hypothetical protein